MTTTNTQPVMAGQRERARSARKRVPAIHQLWRTVVLMDGRDRLRSASADPAMTSNLDVFHQIGVRN